MMKPKFVQITAAAVSDSRCKLRVFALDADGRVYMYHWSDDEAEFADTWLELESRRGVREESE